MVSPLTRKVVGLLVVVALVATTASTVIFALTSDPEPVRIPVPDSPQDCEPLADELGLPPGDERESFVDQCILAWEAENYQQL